MKKNKIIYTLIACVCVLVCVLMIGLMLQKDNDAVDVAEEEMNNFILTAGAESVVSAEAFQLVTDGVTLETTVQDTAVLGETDEEDATEEILEVGVDFKYVVADVDDYVNVRNAPSTQGNIVGRIYAGAVAEVLEVAREAGGAWYKIISGEVEGYVKAEFFIFGEEAEEVVSASTELTYAKTIEEIKEEEAIPILQDIVFPETSYASNEELRKAIVEYAKQYVGYPYVSGGTSLATGTDCSGFTCFIYKDFGYSLDRTPQGQFDSAGRSIDYSQIQPGDIICYSSNGGASCTHVAIYIGDGQIVHAANSRKGVIIEQADYSPIIDIKNVID